jgi:hypothetical protein
VLFAAGAGGDPERHRPLLDHLAVHGCQVIAPCFDRLAAEASTTQQQARPLGLVKALHERAATGVPVVAVGQPMAEVGLFA